MQIKLAMALSKNEQQLVDQMDEDDFEDFSIDYEMKRKQVLIYISKNLLQNFHNLK